MIKTTSALHLPLPDSHRNRGTTSKNIFLRFHFVKLKRRHCCVRRISGHFARFPSWTLLQCEFTDARSCVLRISAAGLVAAGISRTAEHHRLPRSRICLLSWQLLSAQLSFRRCATTQIITKKCVFLGEKKLTWKQSCTQTCCLCLSPPTLSVSLTTHTHTHTHTHNTQHTHTHTTLTHNTHHAHTTHVPHTHTHTTHTYDTRTQRDGVSVCVPSCLWKSIWCS